MFERVLLLPPHNHSKSTQVKDGNATFCQAMFGGGNFQSCFTRAAGGAKFTLLEIYLGNRCESLCPVTLVCV
jgi:hypothetical protein